VRTPASLFNTDFQGCQSAPTSAGDAQPVSTTRVRPDRGMNLFNGTPWAVPVTVGAITVTAQATSSPDRHDTQGSGDFYLATYGDIHLAITGDLQLAKNGDFHMATDIPHAVSAGAASTRRAVSVVRHQRRAI
jgi:hypothetical protein